MNVFYMYLPAQKIQSPSLLQFYLLPTCRPRTVQSVRASFPVVKRQYYWYLLYINYSIYSILLDLSSIGWTEKHTAGKTKDWTPRQRANQAPPPFFFLTNIRTCMIIHTYMLMLGTWYCGRIRDVTYYW